MPVAPNFVEEEAPRVEAAHKAILQFVGEGHPAHYEDPSFLVSKLEDIKMSLIGAATQNAERRAVEFAKNGNARLGAMRSASQGAFYILPAGASVDSNQLPITVTVHFTCVLPVGRDTAAAPVAAFRYDELPSVSCAATSA